MDLKEEFGLPLWPKNMHRSEAQGPFGFSAPLLSVQIMILPFLKQYKKDMILSEDKYQAETDVQIQIFPKYTTNKDTSLIQQNRSNLFVGPTCCCRTGRTTFQH